MRQEKTVFCIFVIVFLGTFLFDIETGCSQKFSFGFKASGGFGWAGFGDREQKDTFSTRISPTYGVGFQIGFPLKNEFQLKLEAGYSREGRRLVFNEKLWDN